MSIECAGPVTMADTSRLLSSMRGLVERAQVNEQLGLHMVLALTADSFADNLEMVSDAGDHD